MTAGVAAKHAPIVLPVLSGALAMDDPVLVKAAAIGVGLLLGALWRAGSLIGESKPWAVVRRDLLISVLIGGANAVLALSLADLLGMGPLLSMGLGVVVGATGLRALPEIRDWALASARRRLLGDDVALIQPRDPEARELVRKLDDPVEPQP